jgi:hypothetical protein
MMWDIFVFVLQMGGAILIGSVAGHIVGWTLFGAVGSSIWPWK